MIVGDIQRFAVDYEFDEAQEAAVRHQFVFGRVCFWLGGSPVGDRSACSSLGTIAASLRRSIARRPERCTRAALCELPTAELFAELDCVVYGVGREDLLREDPRERPYLSFFLHPNDDTLDGTKIALVESADCQRLTWSGEDGEVREVRLALGEFEEIAATFVAAVDRWRLGP